MAITRRARSMSFDNVPLGDGIRGPAIDRQSEIAFSLKLAVPRQGARNLTCVSFGLARLSLDRLKAYRGLPPLKPFPPRNSLFVFQLSLNCPLFSDSEYSAPAPFALYRE